VEKNFARGKTLLSVTGKAPFLSTGVT